MSRTYVSGWFEIAYIYSKLCLGHMDEEFTRSRMSHHPSSKMKIPRSCSQVGHGGSPFTVVIRLYMSFYAVEVTVGWIVFTWQANDKNLILVQIRTIHFGGAIDKLNAGSRCVRMEISVRTQRGHTIGSANVELFVRLEQTKHCFGWRHRVTMFTV